MMLTEGTYSIPEGYRVVKFENKISIVKAKSNKLPPGVYRCRDCVHRKEGFVSVNAWHTAWICELKPKEIRDERFKNQAIFYHAAYYGLPCENFKLKK